jgi:hypothetical protein
MHGAIAPVNHSTTGSPIPGEELFGEHVERAMGSNIPADVAIVTERSDRLFPFRINRKYRSENFSFFTNKLPRGGSILAKRQGIA